MITSPWWIALSSFIVTILTTGLVRRYAVRIRMLDIPNIRSSHAAPTPRGGGIAIVFAFYLVVGVVASLGQLDIRLLVALIFGGGALALIGFIDDRRPQDPAVRFGVQVFSAIFIVALGIGIPAGSLGTWNHGVIWFDAVIAVVAIVWMTNLYNFMDGIDGIAASEAAFVTGVGAWLNYRVGGDPGLTTAMLALGAASLGFLCWNWPKAKIFMGDVGSAFLGFVIAVLGLRVTQHAAIPVEVWIILSGVFVVDATVTLLRRILRGDRWFEAHRLHAYQHLARRCGAHSPVTVGVSIINVAWLLPWALFAVRNPALASIALLIALVPIVIAALAAGSGRAET